VTVLFNINLDIGSHLQLASSLSFSAKLFSNSAFLVSEYQVYIYNNIHIKILHLLIKNFHLLLSKFDVLISANVVTFKF